MIRALRGKRRLPWLALGAVLLLLGGGAVMLLFGGGGDVLDRDVEFVDTSEGPGTVVRAPGKHPADDRFAWPMFGYSKGRTHHLAARVTPRPPWQEAWAFRGGVLLEYPPVLCGRSLFLLKNNGTLYSLSRTTGAVRWKRRLGRLAASSPACGHGAVYAVLLSRRNKRKAGLVVRISARTGRTQWSRDLPSRAESSPLLDEGQLFFGTENGTVYSLRARDGSVRWRAKAAGAVKGAIALDAGKLYFGDYGGKVHAIRRSNGAKVWEVSPGGGLLGLSEGNFYSSAAVQYGRVYIGSTNGDVYSFSSADGKLAWRKHTGDYVYASPAVGQVRGGRPTVYIGSYDGRFYALDARSGATRWVRSLGTKISGGATIVGDLVFVSDLGKRTTWALGARTGRTAWKTHRGAFHAAISDGRRIYFTGYSSLFALDPVGRPFARGSAATSRRTAGERRAARRARAERRARRIRARQRARRARQVKFRTAPHGHHHTPRKGGPPRCHLHRHVYRVRARTIVLRHNHCHTHVRRR
ncbi:MAG: PQQ-binding-like beta-propeller repeat protein [Solirubrobacteraceae bacterium]